MVIFFGFFFSFFFCEYCLHSRIRTLVLLVLFFGIKYFEKIKKIHYYIIPEYTTWQRVCVHRSSLNILHGRFQLLLFLTTGRDTTPLRTVCVLMEVPLHADPTARSPRALFNVRARSQSKHNIIIQERLLVNYKWSVRYIMGSRAFRTSNIISCPGTIF